MARGKVTFSPIFSLEILERAYGNTIRGVFINHKKCRKKEKSLWTG